jgi:hypothetical protein
MTTNPHELPKPHEPEDGTFEPEATSVEELLEAKPDYSAEEQNAKGDDAKDDYEPAHASDSEPDEVVADDSNEADEDKNDAVLGGEA